MKSLSQNSTNSSKPPSSDGLRKKNTSLRPKGEKESGGQKGHPGNTLKQVKKPDHTISYQLQTCPCCSSDLCNVKVRKTRRRQVFDIPKPSMEVTEHQVEVKNCPKCNKMVAAEVPKFVKAPVQYGANIRNWAVYLQNQHFIPEDRLKDLFKDIFGVSPSSHTINSFSSALYDNLGEFEADALKKISKEAAVKHLDETGFRIDGKTQWLHVASDEKYTCYHVSEKRKSLLEGLLGTVIHDHWKPYFQLDGVKHGLCNAHHLRELNALIEDNEEWAWDMSRILSVMLKFREHYGKEDIPPDKIERLRGMYDRIVQSGLAYHQALPSLPAKTKRGRRRHGHNLALRLKNYSADVLRFLTDPKVPFTNNQAERDLPMMKCKQKISGGFRTIDGAKQFARIRGFISTAKKQGLNVLEVLSQAMFGQTLVQSV